ncbi:MAG: GyrI-like domain-containing protein, partial [Flavisolibacter sp.]
EKKLVGKKLRMSLQANKTQELWRSFMPERMKIKNRISSDLYSIRIYESLIEPSNMAQPFDKWAAAEVKDFVDVPEGMESFVLNGGLYAVFDYQGLNTDNRIFIYIFSDWLPNSEYELDNRPQFEVLGEKYKNNDPDSQEEIWIPVKLKN